MGETRFIIAEMGDWGQPVGEVANYVVTETELYRRCLAMCVYYQKHGVAKIGFLLHGAEKEE